MTLKHNLGKRVKSVSRSLSIKKTHNNVSNYNANQYHAATNEAEHTGCATQADIDAFSQFLSHVRREEALPSSKPSGHKSNMKEPELNDIAAFTKFLTHTGQQAVLPSTKPPKNEYSTNECELTGSVQSTFNDEMPGAFPSATPSMTSSSAIDLAVNDFAQFPAGADGERAFHPTVHPENEAFTDVAQPSSSIGAEEAFKTPTCPSEIRSHKGKSSKLPVRSSGCKTTQRLKSQDRAIPVSFVPRRTSSIGSADNGLNFRENAKTSVPAWNNDYLAPTNYSTPHGGNHDTPIQRDFKLTRNGRKTARGTRVAEMDINYSDDEALYNKVIRDRVPPAGASIHLNKNHINSENHQNSVKYDYSSDESGHMIPGSFPDSGMSCAPALDDAISSCSSGFFSNKHKPTVDSDSDAVSACDSDEDSFDGDDKDSYLSEAEAGSESPFNPTLPVIYEASSEMPQLYKIGGKVYMCSQEPPYASSVVDSSVYASCRPRPAASVVCRKRVRAELTHYIVLSNLPEDETLATVLQAFVNSPQSVWMHKYCRFAKIKHIPEKRVVFIGVHELKYRPTFRLHEFVPLWNSEEWGLDSGVGQTKNISPYALQPFPITYIGYGSSGLGAMRQFAKSYGAEF